MLNFGRTELVILFCFLGAVFHNLHRIWLFFFTKKLHSLNTHLRFSLLNVDVEFGDQFRKGSSLISLLHSFCRWLLILFFERGNVLILNCEATRRLLQRGPFFHVGVILVMTTFRGRHWGRPDFQPFRRSIRFRTGTGLIRCAARVMPGPDFRDPFEGGLFFSSFSD